MSESAYPIKIALRIPGLWSSPKHLMQRIPAGFRFTPDALILPNDTHVEFQALGADQQFAQIFRSSCRRPAHPDELATVDRYSVNFCLSGPGGSLESAQNMMDAGSAIIRAGGAGVFIDNCTLAHGGRNWIAMAEDGSPDALSFAFTSIVQGRTEVYTMGLHVLGLPDIVMKRADAEADEFGIIEVIQYLVRGEKAIGDGHLLADPTGPRFQTKAEPNNGFAPGSPMHNPFGRLRLVSMRDVAERN